MSGDETPQTGPARSAQEEAVLRRDYRRLGAARHASTSSLTQARARRLWTDQELQILERHYPTRGTAIANRLQRSIEAIKCQAARQKIRYTGPNPRRKPGDALQKARLSPNALTWHIISWG